MSIRTILSVLALVVACNDDDNAGELAVAEASRAELQWKRNAALERDLARALELAPGDICSELGRGSCTRAVHHIALGGADPLTIGLYEPLPDTLVSTPVVLDRVVLSACANRAALDRQGPAVVFTALDLDDARAPDADDEAYAATITSLYRRLLSRDPLPTEITTLEKLLVDADGKPISAHDFATLSCFAIATTSEFLFF